jgi:ParB-like chromosome segregation protein Spo0J/DNA modification methylase
MSNPIIKLAEVDRKDRVREEYHNIEGLAASIKENGLIQPLILKKTKVDELKNGPRPDGKTYIFELGAGGRRSMALDLLGIVELEYGITCQPGKAGYLFEENLTDIQKLVIELEENLHREDLTWLESARQIVKVHRLKKAESIEVNQSWGQRQTGLLLQTSLGSVNNAVKVVEAIESGNSAVGKADSLTAALQVLLDQKEHQALKLLAEQSKIPMATTAVDSAGKPIGMAALKDDANWLEPSGSQIEQDGKAATGPIVTQLDNIEIPLSKMLFQGDSVKDLMPTYGAESFDGIYTDIPYGTDPGNMEYLENFEQVVDEHQIVESVELMPKFLLEAYRTLKTGGHLIFWYDIEHHEKLMKWGLAAGFKVQRWPLHWDKLHPCKNQAPQYNWTKSVETAMVMRKGNAVLVKPQSRNIFACDGSIERKMYKNPFAKPFELHKWVLDAVSIQGQTWLDPFAGDGSIPRAQVNLGLRPMAMEISDNHFPRLVENMKNVYQAITHGKAQFV